MVIKPISSSKRCTNRILLRILLRLPDQILKTLTSNFENSTTSIGIDLISRCESQNIPFRSLGLLTCDTFFQGKRSFQSFKLIFKYGPFIAVSIRVLSVEVYTKSARSKWVSEGYRLKNVSSHNSLNSDWREKNISRKDEPFASSPMRTTTTITSPSDFNGWKRETSFLLVLSRRLEVFFTKTKPMVKTFVFI